MKYRVFLTKRFATLFSQVLEGKSFEPIDQRMDETLKIASDINLTMATEDHYRKQAAFYRNSDEYNLMIRRYPILESSIKDCQGEKRVV